VRIPGKYIRVSWVAFVVITILALIGTVARRKSGEIKDIIVNVKQIGSDEHEMLNATDVTKILDNAMGSEIKGSYIKHLDLGRVEQILEENPSVSNAEAFINGKNELEITIMPREPILRVIDNRGGNYFLDPKGTQMPTSRLYTPRVLVVTGNVPIYLAGFLDKDKGLMKDIFNLAKKIGDDGFMADMIEQIHITNVGEIVLVPQVGKQKILFGDAENVEEKFKNLLAFYKEGMPYSGWNKYNVIDVRFKGQVVCR
jgi:cell division protein FtsQ